MGSWPDWHRIIGKVWHDLANMKQEEKETHKRKLLKLNISSCFSFICFSLFAFMCILVPIRLWVFVMCFSCLCMTTLKKGKMKSSIYGLLTDIALLVECLAPGQNCIICIICMKSKNLLRKNEEYSSLILKSFISKWTSLG